MIALVAVTTADMGFFKARLERTATSALGQSVAIEGEIGVDLLGGPAIVPGGIASRTA